VSLGLIARLALVLGIISALGAIGSGIYTAGKRSARAEYAERDNKAILAAQAERDAALEKIKAIEDRAQADNVRIQLEANNEVQTTREDADRTLASERKLRQSLTCRPAADHQDSAGKAGAASSESAQAEHGGLSRGDENFLIRLAERCRAVAIERNEAAAIAIADRARQDQPTETKP